MNINKKFFLSIFFALALIPFLASAQNTPSITVASPNGGESYDNQSGNVFVTYRSTNIAGKPLLVYLYSPTYGNVREYPTIASDDGTFSFFLGHGGADNPGQYKITICASDVDNPLISGKPLCDSSDNTFVVTGNLSQVSPQPKIILIYPNGGENLANGTKDLIVYILWNTSDFGSKAVDLSLVDYRGYVVRSIVTATPNTGSYAWRSDSSINSGFYKILAGSNDKGPSAQDYSDGYFTITTVVSHPSTPSTPATPTALQEESDTGSNTSACLKLVNNLRYRSADITTGGEVSLLQDFLQSGGYLNTEPTGFFGLMTQNAVRAFQNAKGITPAVGYVGPTTRARIQAVSCVGASNGISNAAAAVKSAWGSFVDFLSR